MSAHTQPRVAAVVVAWNRAELLQETLDGLAAQVRPLDDIIVVDNASTDETPALLARHPAVTHVVAMPENLGGAGGFSAGIARAVERGADLVWIMDDDTIPTPMALAELLAARSAYQGTPAILACRADWIDGREHPMNVPRERPLVCAALRRKAKAVGAIQIRTASFVAILIDTRAILEDGLPTADYFLWNDDFEYTARLLRRRIGLYIPAARVEHRTKVFGNSTADPGARFYNEVRNKLWTYTRSSALNPLEKALYGGRTALRWAGLLARSDDKKAAWGYIAEGIKDGLTAPKSTTQVLSGTPVASAAWLIEAGAGRDEIIS